MKEDPNAEIFTSGMDFGGFLSFWGLLITIYLVSSYFSNTFSMVLADPTANEIAAFLIVNGVWLLIFLAAWRFQKGLRYRINDDHLIISLGGYIIDKIDVRTIEKVRRTYNPLASAAISLKRLAIYKTGNQLAALISPTPEKAFIEVLIKMNPNIQVVGVKKNEET